MLEAEFQRQLEIDEALRHERIQQSALQLQEDASRAQVSAHAIVVNTSCCNFILLHFIYMFDFIIALVLLTYKIKIHLSASAKINYFHVFLFTTSFILIPTIHFKCTPM